MIKYAPSKVKINYLCELRFKTKVSQKDESTENNYLKPFEILFPSILTVNLKKIILNTNNHNKHNKHYKFIKIYDDIFENIQLHNFFINSNAKFNSKISTPL